MNKKILNAGKRRVLLYYPDACIDCPIVYTHASEEEMEGVVSLVKDIRIILAAVEEIDWNGELSPWPAPKAFRGGEDFMGGADAYIREFTEQIVPVVEEAVGFIPQNRWIAGYSLAGLFSIYALFQTDLFSRGACISGSLWYDGFLDYMKERTPLRIPDKVYFSLGDREAITKNQRLSKVLDCTMEAENVMKELGSAVLFELNAGNHFVDVSERVAKGLRWLCD